MDTKITKTVSELRPAGANAPAPASAFATALPFLALLVIGITYNVMFSASRVFSFTAGTLGMLGGVLGSLFIARMGLPVALGGMGNNRGAVIAGLLLGLFQQSANFLVGGIFASVAVFAVFIIVLLVRPEGLAGASAQRRV